MILAKNSIVIGISIAALFTDRGLFNYLDFWQSMLLMQKLFCCADVQISVRLCFYGVVYYQSFNTRT